MRSDAMLDQLIGACERARDDDEVRVVVIGTSHERYSRPAAICAFRRRTPRPPRSLPILTDSALVSLIGKLTSR